MAFIAKPKFPNVPNLPGVPQVPRSPFFPPGPPPVLTGAIALGRLALALISKPQWGIYKMPTPPPDAEITVDEDGEQELPEVTVYAQPAPPVIAPDSFTRFQFDHEYDIGTAPVQQGGFAAYNKVAQPYQIRLRMTKGGSLKERQEFLEKMEAITASLDLYRILTPERVYNDCNIVQCRTVREGARGAFFFAEVEIGFIEIRQVTAQYTDTAQNTANAKNPSALPVSNRGTVNAVPPATRVQSAFDAVLSPLRSLSRELGG